MRIAIGFFGLVGLSGPACVSSGGGGDGDADADVDVDADADVDTTGGNVDDYCELYVPCAHPGAPQSEIDACKASAAPTQACIDCVMNACAGSDPCADCTGATDGCQSSC